MVGRELEHEEKMYHLKPGIKQKPEKRWNLPDRIFFGHGACHILAGVYLESDKIQAIPSGFYAVWIKPKQELSGNHIFVTDGVTTFDFHGYSQYEKLIAHHRKGWSKKYIGWDCDLIKVDFDLLNTESLNARKMLGSDQYLLNPIPRAHEFIDRFEHYKCRN